MSDRLEAAVAELVAAIRAEIAEAQMDAPPVLLTVPEAAARLGIRRTLMYDLLGSGEVESVKVGRRRLVPADALDRYIRTLR